MGCTARRGRMLRRKGCKVHRGCRDYMVRKGCRLQHRDCTERRVRRLRRKGCMDRRARTDHTAHWQQRGAAPRSPKETAAPAAHGSQGLHAPHGPQAPAQGLHGPQGPQAPAQGLQGLHGPQGPQAPAQGLHGSHGLHGPQAPAQGLQGSHGLHGPQAAAHGLHGLHGPQGLHEAKEEHARVLMLRGRRRTLASGRTGRGVAATCGDRKPDDHGDHRSGKQGFRAWHVGPPLMTVFCMNCRRPHRAGQTSSTQIFVTPLPGRL